MNVYDGQRIAAMLTARGYESTEQVADADIIILNTCAVRAKATDKVFSALGVYVPKKSQTPCLALLDVSHVNLAPMHLDGFLN